MTIWKNKEELPDFDREFLEVYKDNSKNIEEFMSENKARKYYLSTPDAIMPSFTVYRELDDVVVKWCYLDDLLALEQHLKEAEEVIEFYRDECFTSGDKDNQDIKTIDNSDIGYYVPTNHKAQEYINKYGVKK